MKNIKVSVSLNRIPTENQILPDFEKARQYLFSHEVNVTWNFKNTDVHGYNSAYVTIPFQGIFLQRYILEGSQNLVTIDPIADINMFVFDENEWKTPPGSQYPLLPNTPTGSCFSFNKKPFVNIPSYVIDHNTGQQWVVICHEIMHALTEMANLAGFPMLDQMDTYDHNADPNFVGGNFYKQWQFLQPFIVATSPLEINLPQVTINRSSDNGIEILGQLRTADGRFGCDTLELPFLKNQNSISAIPTGKYLCKWKFKLNSLAYHYELQNVPNRTGVFIHAGNYYFNSKGCILLGNSAQDINKDGSLDLINSNLMLSAFENKMGKKDFMLQII